MTTAQGVSVVQRHFAASIAASERFFDAEAIRVADCCRRLADRFAVGGTLFVVGTGAQASDAQHVSVEFVHPILVGKRALPAVALMAELAETGDATVARLQTLARANDILLALSAAGVTPVVSAATATARRAGLLTVVVCGTERANDADLAFTVGESHPLIVQEVSETLYHVLWELVHVFLDAGDAPLSSFLPVASGAGVASDDLVAQVVASTRQKAEEITRLRRAVADRYEVEIDRAGEAMASRVRKGGRLLACGNGGSATDAQDTALDAVMPALPEWRRIPALALTDDIGVITAIGNDVGFDHVFARQVAAFGRPDDVAIVFSTSGASRNLVAAMTAAKARGLLTIAMSGGDGGTLARSPEVDFCFTAPSEYLPRIQEAHATSWHALLAATQERLR